MKATGAIGLVLCLSWLADSSLLDPVVENVRHVKAAHPPEKVAGVWRKKMLWKPRWVKEWKQSNVLRPVWKRFWGPVIIREWVPIPKPPPDWDARAPGAKGPAFAPDAALFGDAPEEANKANPSYLLQKPSQQSAAYGFGHAPTKQAYSNYAGNQVRGTAAAAFDHAPALPISTAVSQADSYSGYSSYGNGGDGSAYDLNPPVDAYDPQHGTYGPPRHSAGNFGQGNAGGIVNNHAGYDSGIQQGHHAGQGAGAGFVNNNAGYDPGNQLGLQGTHDHGYHHHHHHHHHDHHGSYSHNYDQTRLPPGWNAWKPLPPAQSPRPPSLVQQASSSVSVFSKLRGGDRLPQGLHPGVTNYLRPPGPPAPHNDFIQQASLVGEYHYADNALTSHTPSHTLSHTPSHAPLKPVPAAAPPKPAAAPTKPAAPPPKPPVPQKPVAPPRNPTKADEHVAPRAKPPATPAPPRPNIKPLPPTSVSTFHFIEAIPSNQTQTKASLIGNLNKTLSATREQQESNQVSIITPRPYKKESRPNIAKLAHSIVEQHLKAAQKVSPTSKTEKPASTTVRPAATTTSSPPPPSSSSIKHSLANYLVNERVSEKAPKVFIVTPTPQKKAGES